MKGFATSLNPYTTGLRPRSFFAARVEMLRKEKMLKKVGPNSYPKYDLKKDEYENKAA